MSIFGTIVDKIFHSSQASAVTAIPSPSIKNIPQGAAAAPTSVDVDSVLTQMAATAGEKLNYKESIVDLLKLLKLDSSLTARKELAQELHFTGDTDDSASMNMWLQKQVTTKLAENGGKVPPELKA